MKQIAKIACLLLGLAISNPFMKAENKKSMNIVFIGNSITAGALIADPAHNAPPVKAAAKTHEDRHRLYLHSA